MSFEDIREDFTEIKIQGKNYKITYDFDAIQKLEQLYETNCFNIGLIIDGVRNKSIKDIVEFCHIGFLRYQPYIDIETLKDHRSILELFDKCIIEYMRTIQMPDAFEQLVYQPKNGEKKKIKSKLSTLLGIIFKR